MNFIIEVIKKSLEEPVLVFVVRRQDGFPLLVADDLKKATDFIENQINEALKPKSDA